MNDQDFLQAFESATLDTFPHRSHIRMAWLYLRRDGLEQGTQHIIEGIQKFAAALGASSKYHETITRFWIYAVNLALHVTPDEADFDVFASVHPLLLNGGFINEFYSRDRLNSEAARRSWLEPDLKPLPGGQHSE